MTINIKLRPEDESALRERARMSGRDLAGYLGLVLEEHLRGSRPDIGPVEPAGATSPTLEDLIDWEAVASCEEEADDEISLEEVRAATSTIKDSMARVVIEEERAERF
jgi:transcriptional regulator with XRE-family HTH domain